MKTKCLNNLNKILFMVLILLIIPISIWLFTSQTIFQALRITFGSLYVLFLSGFILSFVFFPKTKEFCSKDCGENGSIDCIERAALSFALSIAIVPLAVFYLNLIGVKINLLNSFLTILGLIVISGVILWVKARKR